MPSRNRIFGLWRGGGGELGQRWGKQGQARGSELSEHCGVCM